MTLIGLLVALIVICLVFWCVRSILGAFGVGDPIATIIQVIFVLFVVLWIVGALGGGSSLGSLGSLRLR